MSWKWKTASPEETWKLAQRLGTLLRGKEVLCLSGDLGAGKTLFSQGLASGLGVAEDVTSPTFTLMNVYQSGKVEMYHFDLYRLEDASQLWDIDFYTYVEGRGIALIEWPDAFWEEMPAEHLRIYLRCGAAQDERELELEPHGEGYQRLCEELKADAGIGS